MRHPGPSPELRRFAAGLRAVTAMLCTLLLVAEQATEGWAILALLGYALWAGYVLWAEGEGRPPGRLLLHFWVDVVWTVLLLRGVSGGSNLLALTFIQPVVMASISHGARHGVLLGCVAALGLVIDASGSRLEVRWLLPAIGVLCLAPAAALISRPMSELRQRLALMSLIEAEADPRRGLDALSLALVKRLRSETGAVVVALVLPRRAGAPAALCTPDDGPFHATLQVQQQLESLLQALPQATVSYMARRRMADRVLVHDAVGAADAAAAQALGQLAGLLEADRLIVLPMRSHERLHGHLIVGHLAKGEQAWKAESLIHLMPELTRLIEQAGLVDELQAEITAHERARIGRDLHDSAIQPYLGIKYAIEGLAVRVTPENPLHDDVQSLMELVNHEVGELREVISVMRSGESRGDNALLPAVRRQVRRFSQLFGIQVHLECPNEVTTSRALAGALFHMLNEALNNVRKHTRARHAWVRLEASAEAILLIVRDDAGTLGGRPVDDFVPRSLSERVHELGGSLQLIRSNGLDTELHISVPV